MGVTEAKQTEGSRMLAAITKQRGVTDVARQCKANRAAVYHWMSGRNLPNARAQDAIFSAFGIPTTAWELASDDAPPKAASPVAATPSTQAKTPRPAPAVPRPDPDAAATKSALDLAKEQVQRVTRRLLDSEDADVSLQELGRQEVTLAKCLALYSQLSGERELSESMIVRSAPWAKLLRLVHEALEPFPQAAKAIADKLEAYGQEVA